MASRPLTRPESTVGGHDARRRGRRRKRCHSTSPSRRTSSPTPSMQLIVFRRALLVRGTCSVRRLPVRRCPPSLGRRVRTGHDCHSCPLLPRRPHRPGRPARPGVRRTSPPPPSGCIRSDSALVARGRDDDHFGIQSIDRRGQDQRRFDIIGVATERRFSMSIRSARCRQWLGHLQASFVPSGPGGPADFDYSAGRLAENEPGEEGRRVLRCIRSFSAGGTMSPFGPPSRRPTTRGERCQ